MTLKYFTSSLLEPIGYFLLTIALFSFSNFVNKKIRFSLLAIFLGLTFGVLTYMLIKDDDNNTHLYSLIYLLTGTGWCLYFLSLFALRIKKVITILVLVILVSYYLFTNMIMTAPIVFDSIGYVITSCGTILLIFLFYHQLLTTIKEEPLSLNFDFWITSSQLIYCLGAFGIFLTYNHFTVKILPVEHFTRENRRILTYLWGVHNVLLFLASLLVCVGVFWIVYQKKSKNQPDYKSQ